jgi:nicotinamidase-related amidase
MARALLVIDVQRIYTEKASELFCKSAEDTVERINALIKAAKRAGDLVVYVRHIHKADGSDLGRMFDFTGEPEADFNFKEGSPEIEYDTRLVRIQGAPEVVKNRYSAFAGTELDTLLRKHNIDTVVVCGFMTNFCCDSTARDAHDRDYFVDFIIDATGTPGTEHMGQVEIRKAVADFHEAGYSRVSRAKKFLAPNRR